MKTEIKFISDAITDDEIIRRFRTRIEIDFFFIYDPVGFFFYLSKKSLMQRECP